MSDRRKRLFKSNNKKHTALTLNTYGHNFIVDIQNVTQNLYTFQNALLTWTDASKRNGHHGSLAAEAMIQIFIFTSASGLVASLEKYLPTSASVPAALLGTQQSKDELYEAGGHRSEWASARSKRFAGQPRDSVT